MFSSKSVALEALTHCINLSDPFADLNCGAGCPLWRDCTGQDIDVILSDLRDILLSLRDPSADPLISRIQPMIDDVEADPTPLFTDIYAYLKEAGAYA